MFVFLFGGSAKYFDLVLLTHCVCQNRWMETLLFLCLVGLFSLESWKAAENNPKTSTHNRTQTCKYVWLMYDLNLEAEPILRKHQQQHQVSRKKIYLKISMNMRVNEVIVCSSKHLSSVTGDY